jgi:hypothetical protein
MDIYLPGRAFNKFTDPDTKEAMERIYETAFQINIDPIEAITPSAGPLDAPGNLPHATITGKSGRYCDINLSFRELQSSISIALEQKAVQRLKLPQANQVFSFSFTLSEPLLRFSCL